MNTKEYYLKARYIIGWDGAAHRQYENAYLHVKGDKIAGIEKELPVGAECEDLGMAAILPGLINLHSHPSEVYGNKSYKEDYGNRLFYDSSMYDAAGFVSMGEASAEIQTKLNLAEIIRSGCTSAVIFGGPQSRLEAETAGALGMRAWIGGGIRAGDAKEEISIWDSSDGHSLKYTFNEEEGFKRLEEAVAFAKELEGTYEGRIHGLLGPTQTMTCTEEMLRRTRLAADKHGIGITIHGSEDFVELEMSIRTRGKTPVQVMNDTGLLGEDLIIAHCCSINDHSRFNMRGGDLAILGKKHPTLAHCPTVLAKWGDTMETFETYRNAGVNIGIGTDTYPSDFIQEMRWAAVMGKVTGRSTFACSAKDVFYAATVNGAKALGRKDLGILSAGSKADFIVCALDNIEMAPVRDVVKNLIYSATGDSIRSVYVDGTPIMRDGVIDGIEEKELVGELQELAEAAWKRTADLDPFKRSIDQLSPLACPKLDREIPYEC